MAKRLELNANLDDAANVAELQLILQMVNEEQLRAYEIVDDHAKQCEDYAAAVFAQQQLAPRLRRKITQPKPLRLILHGTAGTGKSFLIRAICLRLGLTAILTATTGIAADNIGGETIHAVFHLMAKYAISDKLKKEMQARFDIPRFGASAYVVIVDEYSMLGQKTLDKLSKQAKVATGSNDAFGGLSIILVGDVGQLPPVKQDPLYKGLNGRGTKLNSTAILGYQTFDTVVNLDRVKRQTDPKFRESLLAVRTGQHNNTHIDYFMQRNPSQLVNKDGGLAQIRKCQADGIRLFASNKRVQEYNLERLLECDHVANLEASHTGGDAAASATPETAGGLYKEFQVARESPVMLTANQCTHFGLVNGARGVVKEILYARDDGTCHNPSVIMVDVPKYTGPSCFPPDDILRKTWVPIVPVKRSWTAGKKSTLQLSRTQFPLRLCWAITIHKSQGQTIQFGVVNLGSKDFATGLSYVALSRFPSLQSFIFDTDSELKPARLESIAKSKIHYSMQAELKRLRKLSNDTARKWPVSAAMMQCRARAAQEEQALLAAQPRH